MGSAPEADLTRALYERYATQIFRFCLHRLGSREEAEDAVQSTFLNAFRGLKGGVVPERESAWLFKIAENVCLSRRRSTWRRNRIESAADFEVVEELMPAPSRLADELVGLQDVLEQMPESQRRAILLREWQGLSYREIAAELELSQTAVETLIFRARRSLAKGLAEPPAGAEKRRMVRGAGAGNILAGLKSLLFGGAVAAAKTAAVVAVLGAGTVAVASPPSHHHSSNAPLTPPATAPAASVPVPGIASVRPAPVQKRRRAAAPKAARRSAPGAAAADRRISPAGTTPPPARGADRVPPRAARRTPPASGGRSTGHGRRSSVRGQERTTHGRAGSGAHARHGSDSAPPPAGSSSPGGNGSSGQVNGGGRNGRGH